MVAPSVPEKAKVTAPRPPFPASLRGPIARPAEQGAEPVDGMDQLGVRQDAEESQDGGQVNEQQRVLEATRLLHDHQRQPSGRDNDQDQQESLVERPRLPGAEHSSISM